MNLHLLQEKAVKRVTYLDSDLWFCSDPSAVTRKIADSSVALTPHRSGKASFEDRFGLYNAGWISVGGDEVGISALRWWRERCIEAVPDYPVDGLYTDQKYLERLPDLFENIAVVNQKGLNLAPWNVGSVENLEIREGKIHVDGDLLIAFHFHGLQRVAWRLFDPGYGLRGHLRVIREALYRPYLQELADCSSVFRDKTPLPQAEAAPWGATRPRARWWKVARQAKRLTTALLTARLMWSGETRRLTREGVGNF